MRTALLLIAALFIAAQASAFTINVYVVHATCGAATGSATATPTGGSWPYTYLWSNGSTTSELGNVAPGIYTITITDANNASATLDVEILATTSLFIPMDPLTIWSCAEDCSSFLWDVDPDCGGVGPFSTLVDPPGPEASIGPTYAAINSLCANTTYTFTVTDMNGCTGTYGPVIVTDAVIPEILSSTITPSCSGGNTGAMTVAYDQLDSLYVIGPDQAWYAPTQNPFTLTNLAPGQYVLNSTLIQDDLPENVFGSYCYHSDTLVIPETTAPCGALSGTVFADVNDDCAQNGGEPGLAYRVLTIEPGGFLEMTDAAGSYSGAYPYGTYGLDESLDDYTSECVTLPAPFTLDAGNTNISIDLAVSPDFGPDLSVFLFMSGHVPGNNATYHIEVHNTGPFTFNNVDLDLDFENWLTFISADGSPVLLPGLLQWSVPSIAAYSNFVVEAVFLVPTTTQIGATVPAIASITLLDPDAQPDNDQYSAVRNVTSSFDPNDKLCVTSSRLSATSYYLDADSYVDYTIRFQNTGTGPAYNVHLLDTITPLLDLTSFTILAASHDYTASLGDARDLRFDFPNIMLPDSGSNMAGSQGFIAFRLKPVESIELGDELVNAADIFFDFNEPVRTNDAVLVVDHFSGVEEPDAAALAVYPNPVTDLLHINLTGDVVRMDVISVDGRMVLSQRAISGANQFDTRALTPGAYSLRVLSASGAVRHARFVKR